MQHNEIWSEALNFIKGELSFLVFNDYVKPIEPVYYKNDIFVLKMLEHQKNCIEKKYHILIVNALRYATSGRNINVKYITSDSELEQYKTTSKTEQPQVKEVEVKEVAHTNKLSFNPKYTFDTFVVGTNNRLAHAASIAVAQNPARKYNPLFIYGGVGLGKTHLMQAIAQYVLKENPDFNISFISSEKYTNEFIDAIKRESNIQFRNKYRNVDMLLVDDIQFLSGKEGTQEEFFHNFNDLYNDNKQIIITSDKPPSDIPNLEERLLTRFEWGLTCDITSPNYETRMAILRKKAEDENYVIGDDIIEFIAENVPSNIRVLEGILLKVKAITDYNNKPITIEELKAELKDIIKIKEKKISVELIIQTTSKFYNLTYSDILSSKRTMNIANARQVCMYLARKLTQLSLPSIGDSIGGRDHSTVIHAYNKIEKNIKENSTLNKEIEQIINIIKNTY